MIDCEMGRLNIEVAALQETRLTEYGTVLEKDFNFFGKESPQKKHGYMG